MVRTLLLRALAATGALALGAAVLPVAAQEGPPPDDTVPAEEPDPTTTTTPADPEPTVPEPEPPAPATPDPGPPADTPAPPADPGPPPDVPAAAVVEALPEALPEQAPPDPPGNNGTVKIDGLEFDSHPDNQPHVGCVFQVDFYGYDEGELFADLTFEGIPPTGGGTLASDTIFIGEDPAGGGTDFDGGGTYDLSAALAGIEPHPVQGHHVRLTVHADGSIGSDTKHKVFWVEGCGGPTTTTTVPETTTTVPGSTTTLPAGSVPPGAPPGAPPAVEHAAPVPAAAAPAAKPVSESKAGDLPTTGSDVLDLVLTALALVGAGTGLVLVGRRRIANEGTSR